MNAVKHEVDRLVLVVILVERQNLPGAW